MPLLRFEPSTFRTWAHSVTVMPTRSLPPTEICWSFEGIYYLQLQGRTVTQETSGKHTRVTFEKKLSRFFSGYLNSPTTKILFTSQSKKWERYHRRLRMRPCGMCRHLGLETIHTTGRNAEVERVWWQGDILWSTASTHWHRLPHRNVTQFILSHLLQHTKSEQLSLACNTRYTTVSV